MLHLSRRFMSALVLLMAGLSSAAVAQAQHPSGANRTAPYTLRSLEGTYAVVGTFGNHVAQSQDVWTFDGKGNCSAVALLNEPDPNGQRVLVPITISGTYTVDPNGTGVLVLTVTLSNDGTIALTEDVLITRAKVTDGQKVATEYVGMLRELAVGVGGAEGTFATFVATRRPDTMTRDGRNDW